MNTCLKPYVFELVFSTFQVRIMSNKLLHCRPGTIVVV